MDLPKRVIISEEGPREGFQIEKGPIRTADKIALVDALSGCGLAHIQVGSFVNAKHVPGWADAEEVFAGFVPREGIDYSAVWFNEAGLRRALAFKDKLTLAGFISLSASEPFAIRNLNRDRAGQIEAMTRYVQVHRDAGLPIGKIIVMAAFGCNFAGDISTAKVVETVADALAIARDACIEVNDVTLADSMGWATPRRVASAIGAVRDRWPELKIALHLHDTRGQGIACAYEGLRLGVTSFDAAVGGLGGCPFAGQPGAPGNIATEELALLCEEMGISTGLDLEALIEVARLAERIVGHSLPSAALRSGTLATFRRNAA
ncbi:hydroxymethylglutaryl-CoA lyase [Bradyrhizobium centrolobii]|uniref:Hydroxymethylglutaryl-CoA lyase n=1 Tax=Bradyrhizobium centrolobii TaxID=1505087 RepID=A0A176YQR7_9BRAD|nr:hydroxymethylglutaryl-CoA lyase [Bradyrhizobium centrolobii]OAF08566.1 hydroxymethylglutaryl-CoA lyase [Bradyrhizobium centrolobii]